MVAVIFTIPEKPLTLENVKLVVTEDPCETVIEFEFTVMLKFGGGGGTTVKNAWTECESLPLEPVMFSASGPSGAEFETCTVSVAFPVPTRSETELGFTAKEMLGEPRRVAFKLTLPAKL